MAVVHNVIFNFKRDNIILFHQDSHILFVNILWIIFLHRYKQMCWHERCQVLYGFYVDVKWNVFCINLLPAQYFIHASDHDSLRRLVLWSLQVDHIRIWYLHTSWLALCRSGLVSIQLICFAYSTLSLYTFPHPPATNLYNNIFLNYSIPIALSMLLSKRKQLYFILFALVYGAMILVSNIIDFSFSRWIYIYRRNFSYLTVTVSTIHQVPLIIVDSYYYGKLVIAPLNAVLYNVFNTHGGPELYGVEGITYYLVNLMLNFNLALVASLFSLPMLVSINEYRL